ncbi:m01 protein [Murid betaherpesvirus 1]|nr:m01 protein [Murid betaherpesvirus 1]
MKRIGLERCFLSTSYRSTRFPSTALPRLTAERRSTFFTPDPKPRGGGAPPILPGYYTRPPPRGPKSGEATVASKHTVALEERSLHGSPGRAPLVAEASHAGGAPHPAFPRTRRAARRLTQASARLDSYANTCA